MCDAPFIYADCGHEVYEGEYVYTSETGATLCPDCMRDVLAELPLYEQAENAGYGHGVV
jgi:hypothetical protein